MTPHHSPLTTRCRLLLDPQPSSGAWNMAVDEVLIEAALADGVTSVRCYEWEVPTVSLGYFQDAAEVGDNPRLDSLAVVRRLSGGGAILHHRELTYSCAVPCGHSLAATPATLYDVAHQAIIAALNERGVSTSKRGETLAARDGQFLCYGRGDSRDIVLAGHKIVGSAQRRRRGAVLQHGSILLAASPLAPEFPGINDLAHVRISAADLARPLAEAIASRLGFAPERTFGMALPPDKHRRAEFLCAACYCNLERPRRRHGVSRFLSTGHRADRPNGGHGPIHGSGTRQGTG